jgi:hypothetical protein
LPDEFRTPNTRGDPQPPDENLYLACKVPLLAFYKAMYSTPKKASAACLYVYLILLHRHRIRKDKTTDAFQISFRQFEAYGIRSDVAWRALKALRKTGIVKTAKLPGRMLHVLILIR